MRTQYRTILAVSAMAVILGGATACGEPPTTEAEATGPVATDVPVLAESTTTPAPLEDLVTETAPEVAAPSTGEAVEGEVVDDLGGETESVEDAAPVEEPTSL